MAKRPRPRTAFATWHPTYGMNTYWLRPRAKDIREQIGLAYWQKVKARGWKIVRVKVTVDSQ